MAESRMNRNTLILIIVLLIMSIMTGCFMREDTRQTTYHDNVEDLEKYILSDLGEFIMFEQPVFNAFTSLEDGNDNEVIVWHVIFLRQYIYDESEISTYPPGRVIADFRMLYNDYMTNHPDHYLSDYYVVIDFYIPAKNEDDFPPSRQCGYMSSREYGSWDKNNQLIVVSLDDDFWKYMYDQSDIETAYMAHNSIEQIIQVVDNMSQLNEIIVSDQQTADELFSQRPDSRIIVDEY